MRHFFTKMPLPWKVLLQSTASIISLIIITRELLKPRHEGLSKLQPKSRGVQSLIGNTQLVEIKSLSRFTGCKIYAKLELNNPGGSAKDRVALAIIQENERSGILKPGDVIFEGTSGSTGISLAMLANAMGYKAHICLPNDTSEEKMQLLRLYGAIISPVPPASIVDPNQYTNIAKCKCEELNNDPNSSQKAIFADQFENELNWKIHYKTTGPEIYQQMGDDIVDYFIAGSGTGGTITGVSKYLKEKLETTKVILADPQGSGLANRVNFGVMFDQVEKEGTRRRHQVDTIVEGIGLNRLTANFKRGEHNIDEAIRVSDEEALSMAKFLSINDGFFWGSSSAINCVAAVKTALKNGRGKNIVVIACDSGTRHMSKFWKYAGEVDEDITLEEIVGMSEANSEA